jgi:hypothetical protein
MAVVEIRVSSDRWVCASCGRRYRIPHMQSVICTCGGRDFVQRVRMMVT